MSDDLRALGNIILARQAVLRSAFGQLVASLAAYGAIDAELLLERLHMLHSQMPTPSEAATEIERLQAESGLEEIRAILETVERALPDGEADQ